MSKLLESEQNRPSEKSAETRSNRSSRQRDPEITRINILEAATVEFADKGLAGARVDEIARKTATSKHMIYYYFGSKDGLYQAVLARAYQNFRLAEEAVDYNSLDPVEAMRSLVGQTFDVHLGNPNFVRIIMGENINNGEHIHHVTDVGNRRAILDTMREIIERGERAGQFKPGLDLLHLHMTVSALCFYFVSNRFTFGHIFEIDFASSAFIAERRSHIIETVLSACLQHDG